MHKAQRKHWHLFRPTENSHLLQPLIYRKEMASKLLKHRLLVINSKVQNTNSGRIKVTLSYHFISNYYIYNNIETEST